MIPAKPRSTLRLFLDAGSVAAQLKRGDTVVRVAVGIAEDLRWRARARADSPEGKIYAPTATRGGSRRCADSGSSSRRPSVASAVGVAPPWPWSRWRSSEGFSQRCVGASTAGE